MSNGSNGHALESVRTKAIVDALKEYVDTTVASRQSTTTQLGPVHTTEITFPTDKLSEVLARELSKALAAIRWPTPEVQVGSPQAFLNNDAVAKALLEVGKMVATVPLPVVEALDLSPLIAVMERAEEGNQAMAAAMDRQASAIEKLAKALTQPSKPASIKIQHSDGTESTVVRE